VDDEIKGHLAAIEQWIVDQRNSFRHKQGLSSQERQQLQAVNKSIQQLSALGVLIPDQLRELKLSLSARDAELSDSVEARERAEDVTKLADGLATLAQKAKTLANTLRTTGGKVSGTKTVYDASLQDLVRGGHLSPDDRLLLIYRKSGPEYEGKVREDGTLSVRTPSGWQDFDSVSAAANDLFETRLNGWKHWHRVNADGTRTSLKEIRDRFLHEEGTE
jgi:X-X-X-Leu-X-X-Gly heptad repeat protein